MTLQAYQNKIQNWRKKFPKYTNKAIKKILLDIKNDIKNAYSGSVVGVRTGKTRKAIATEYKPAKNSAKVYVKEPRAFIAFFQEVGTKFMRAKPVFEPMRNKYTPKTASEIMKRLIAGYKAGG